MNVAIHLITNLPQAKDILRVKSRSEKFWLKRSLKLHYDFCHTEDFCHVEESLYIYIYKDMCLLGLPTTKARDIVFRFIIEYSNLRDFGP